MQLTTDGKVLRPEPITPETVLKTKICDTELAPSSKRGHTRTTYIKEASSIGLC